MKHNTENVIIDYLGIDLDFFEFVKLHPPAPYRQDEKFAHYDQRIIDHRDELGKIWLNFHNKKSF